LRKLYILKLAARNILAHKLRSLLTISGVAIGVCFIIFLVSLGFGLQRISTTQIANINALQIIDVTPGKSKIVKIGNDTVERFSGISKVSEVTPSLNIVGKIDYKTSTVEGVVYGKNLEYLAMEEPEMLSGTLYKSNLNREVVVNQTVLKRLGITDPNKIIGEAIDLNVIINSEYFETDDEEPITKEDSFVIVGVMRNESSPYVYVPLEIFKSYGVDYYSNAKIKISDKEFTDNTKRELESLGFKPTSLKDTVDQINQFFVIFQLILALFGAIAVVVAAIGMFNTLTISLIEKTREISFMKVMGTTKKDIWRLFLFEAFFIGIVGSIIGVTVGILAGGFLNSFLIDLAQKTGNKPVVIFYTPWLLIVITILTSAVLSFITGIYPSYRASRIDPLEAMRYE
jgi:putative ABC transport system permease protein